MSRTCPNCYSLVKDEHKFCTQCGKEVPKETKNENTEKDNQSLNEIKYDNDMGWGKASIISFMILIFFVIFFYSTSSSNNSVQKELPKVEANEPVKNELSLEEKSTLFKEAKKDFDTKNYDSSILKFNKLLGLNYKLDEVNFYLGQNWYMKKVYSMAIVYYKQSALLNTKASYMPTLLFNSAISFENINDMENAKSFYMTLIELYPSSKESKESKQKLSNIKDIKNNNKSTDISSITPIYKPEPIQPIVVSQTEQSLPYNGEIRDYSYSEKIAPLNIKTSYGANYLVKLKDAYNKETIMTIFIIGGNEITVNVPLGSFEITYASGNKWYGYDYLFGKETSYSKANEIFNFRNTGYQISGYTISLYRVSNGNLNTLYINQSQF